MEGGRKSIQQRAIRIRNIIKIGDTGLNKSAAPERGIGGREMEKEKKEKSIQLRNGKIIVGAHYTKNGVVYCETGLSVDEKLVFKKNGRKTIYYY